MQFTIKRKDVAGEILKLDRSPYSGRVTVSLDGKELERLKEKGNPYKLPMKDKSFSKLYIKARWLDPVPMVLLDKELDNTPGKEPDKKPDKKPGKKPGKEPAKISGEKESQKEEILLAEKLRWIDYLFGCFPALMFLFFGPLPTLVAFFMLMANFRILRSKWRPTVKWAAIYALDMVLFWIVYALVKFVVRNS